LVKHQWEIIALAFLERFRDGTVVQGYLEFATEESKSLHVEIVQILLQAIEVTTKAKEFQAVPVKDLQQVTAQQLI
jgi:hypothetical protein